MITLNEASQTKTNIKGTAFMWNPRNDTNELIYKTATGSGT